MPPRKPRSSGPPTFNPATSIFLNCPYDADYRPLFEAAVLATTCSGFTPRVAWDTGTLAEPRMARISRAIFESKYSVHDLSRCKGEGDSNLARFNMPLELGIAMARRYLTRRVTDKHDWIVLVPSGHQYSRYISDLAGFDPATHDGTERGLVFALMPWLATRGDGASVSSPGQVLEALPKFNREMRLLRKTWGPWPPWMEVVLSAKKIANEIVTRFG